MQKMTASKSALLLLVATVSGAVGYFIGSAPRLHTVMLEHAQITQFTRLRFTSARPTGKNNAIPLIA
jgi:hypothetical protein